ncbi:uncharacterized protein hebe [Drosophila tropicalis]|uniref:uncharacterized protein hebe n=1 Tax=Drosophila tropicalis TaxID=46794 RepID=UPI0035ABDFA8
MAETISNNNNNNKPSIQIRSGLPSPLPDKSPSPATKLLISHGKPNFTIARSPKGEENGNPLSPQANGNNNYNAFKTSNSSANVNNSNKFIIGTKFNGVFKPSNTAASWATNGNGNANGTATDNEAAKVILRRPKQADPLSPPAENDENVPEFIRRQRRIQERLAKENVLDFENRRSGYFTHVMISPDSPNRTSFVETMASPAIVPALEMPAPVFEKVVEEEQIPVQATKEEEQAVVTNGNGHVAEEEVAVVSNGNGNDHAAEEEDAAVAAQEVAQAIEEVIKAVAGEADEPEAEPKAVEESQVQAETEPVAVPAPVEAQVEVVEPTVAPVSPVTPVATSLQQNGQAEKEDEAAITISHTNGHTNGETNGHATNGDGPSIPAPDPSGALGVNYEPKTVVSFSQELGSGENNYPDTVKVETTSESTSAADGELKKLTKLKFDIKSDEQNEVQVTPVLRAAEE